MPAPNAQTRLPVVTPKEKRLRVYQNWQGNEVFFFWGHCIAGPNWRSAVGSSLLVAIPSILFLVFVAPWLGSNVKNGWLIVVVSCFLPGFSMVWLFMTACRDPGILPRLEPDDEWRAGRKPRTQDVLVNHHRVTVRYNDTCHFYQPPRAHHCSVNDNCIEKFDHHCPWVGTTIGLRNYRTFLMFIYNTTILLLWTFGCSIAQLLLLHDKEKQELMQQERSTNGAFLTVMGEAPVAVALMIYSFIFFWFVGGLSAFHCYLVATNQTTYENFRYNSSHMPNPYDKGCMTNCMEVWMMRVPKSRINFRDYIDVAGKPGPVEMPYPTARSASSSSGSDREETLPHEGPQYPTGEDSFSNTQTSVVAGDRKTQYQRSPRIGSPNPLSRRAGMGPQDTSTPSTQPRPPSPRKAPASQATSQDFISVEMASPAMSSLTRPPPTIRTSERPLHQGPIAGESGGPIEPGMVVSHWYRNRESPAPSNSSSPYNSPLFDYTESRAGRDMFQSVMRQME